MNRFLKREEARYWVSYFLNSLWWAKRSIPKRHYLLKEPAEIILAEWRVINANPKRRNNMFDSRWST
jgi:hypothetical protein